MSSHFFYSNTLSKILHKKSCMFFNNITSLTHLGIYVGFSESSNSLNIYGLPKLLLAIITPSQFVSFIALIASALLKISPLAKTGILTISFLYP